MKKIKEPFSEEEEPQRTLALRGWIIVAAMAFAFVIYGLFAFFVIGDNQPADWDFGAVKDTPGESVYSTYPYRDRAEEPEPQHIDQKLPKALMDSSDHAPSAPAEGRPASGELQRGAELGKQSQQKGQHPGQAGKK